MNTLTARFICLFLILTACQLLINEAAHSLNPRSEGHVSGMPESLLLNEAFILDAQIAIDSVYNMNYEASLDILDPWIRAYPDHPVWVFWPSLVGWWLILPDIESTEHDDAFIAQLEEALNYSSQILRDRRDIDAMIIKSMCYGLLARHYSNRDRWYVSLRRARRAMHFFQQVERQFPDLPDIQFGLGMSLYFSAFIREAYPVIRPFAWLLPRGNKEEGLKRLNLAAENSTFMIPEATFFLGHIYLHYERQFNKALPYLIDLTSRYPENGYYQRLLIRSHFQNMNYEIAMLLIGQTLEKWENRTQTIDLALKEELYTIRGQILQEWNQTGEAIESFALALNLNSQLKPYGQRRQQVKAAFHLGEIYLSMDEKQAAREFLEKASASELDYHYVDRAKRLLRRAF